MVLSSMKGNQKGNTGKILLRQNTGMNSVLDTELGIYEIPRRVYWFLFLSRFNDISGQVMVCFSFFISVIFKKKLGYSCFTVLC